MPRDPRDDPLRGPLARQADRAAGWLLHLLLGTLSALAGALAGFVFCLYVIIGFWLGESDMDMTPERLSVIGALAGAGAGALLYWLMLHRRH